MFVLCPHCHFLVGIDPRTGKPPATCPKCGGVVVEPLPDMPAEGVRAEEVPAPLAPFAPVELPSVLPTLPDVEPVAEQGQDEQLQLPVQAPAPAEPITAEAVAVEAPAPAPSAAIETAATPEPKPRVIVASQSRTGGGTCTGDARGSDAGAETALLVASQNRTGGGTRTAPATPAAATPAAETALVVASQDRTGVASAASTPARQRLKRPRRQHPADPNRADAMISALQGRRRTIRKPVATSVPPVQPAPVVPAVVASEVEVDALPPAVQIEDVVATTSADAGIEAPAEAPATPPKRSRRTSAATATDADPAGHGRSVD